LGHDLGVPGSFEDLVSEADSASVDGWDFSWLDGRATETRPSWGYQRLLGERLVSASAAVDLQTGGTYFAQHVGPASVVELAEFFLGPRPQAHTERHPDDESAEAKAAGLHSSRSLIEARKPA
jgi:hypothetical protein